MPFPVNQGHGLNAKQSECLNKCGLNYENAFLKLLLAEEEIWFKPEWSLKKKQEHSVWI